MLPWATIALLGTCAEVCKDPHLYLAHGGRADFRGAHGGLYNLLSSDNVSVAVRTEDSLFRLRQLEVNGSFMTEAHVAVRTDRGRWMNASYRAASLNAQNWAWDSVNGSCAKGAKRLPFRLLPHTDHTCDDVRLALEYSTLRVETAEWTIGIAGKPVYGRIAGPHHRVDVSLRQKVADDQFRLQPHGLVGQSFDGDGLPRFGEVDVYPTGAGAVTTRAMAKGAIDGVPDDYRVASAYDVHFPFSAFDAPRRPRAGARLGAGARGVAAASDAEAGAAGAGAVERGLEEAAGAPAQEGRRMSECDCSQLYYPPSAPPAPPLAPGESLGYAVDFEVTLPGTVDEFNATQQDELAQSIAEEAGNGVTADNVTLNVTAGSIVVYARVDVASAPTAENVSSTLNARFLAFRPGDTLFGRQLAAEPTHALVRTRTQAPPPPRPPPLPPPPRAPPPPSAPPAAGLVYVVAQGALLLSYDGGQSWNVTTTPNPPGSTLVDLAYCDSSSVANASYMLGHSGGANWQSGGILSAPSLDGPWTDYYIQHGPDRLTVGADGIVLSARGHYSSDCGATFQPIPSSPFSNWNLFAYGSGVFVGTQAQTAPAIYWSTDGATWTQATLPAKPAEGKAITFLVYGNGVFVAVLRQLNGLPLLDYTYLYYSHDGKVWYITTAGYAGTREDGDQHVLRYSEYHRTFYVIHRQGAGLWTSSDGLNYTAHPFAPGPKPYVDVHPGYASYYARAGSTLITSTDLLSWTAITAGVSNVGSVVGAGYLADPVPPSPPTSPPPSPPHPPPPLPPPPRAPPPPSAPPAAGLVYVVAQEALLLSYDGGQSWNVTTTPNPPGSTLVDLAYCDSSSVANASYMLGHSGGANWQSGGILSAPSLDGPWTDYYIQYGSDSLVVGADGVVLSARGHYSSDCGATFQPIPSSPFSNSNLFAYGSGVFVGTRYNLLTPAIYWSTDGATWTQATLPAKPAEGKDIYHLVYGNGMFVAVLKQLQELPLLDYTYLYYSHDGKVWYITTSGYAGTREGGDLNRLRYSEYHRTFYIFRSQGGVVWTSGDGLNYTAHTFASVLRPLYAHSAYASYYGHSGATVITSPDLLSWTAITAGVGNVGTVVGAGYLADPVPPSPPTSPPLSPPHPPPLLPPPPPPPRAPPPPSAPPAAGIVYIMANDALLFSYDGGQSWNVTTTPNPPGSGLNEFGYCDSSPGANASYMVAYSDGIYSAPSLQGPWADYYIQYGGLGFTVGPGGIVLEGRGHYSSDCGATFQPIPSSPFSNSNVFAYGRGVFVGVRRAAAAVPAPVYWSTDGATWTQGTAPGVPAGSSGFNSLAFANGIFVASLATANVEFTYLFYSYDGKVWHLATAPMFVPVNYFIRASAYHGTFYVQLPGGQLWQSADGLNYTATTFAPGPVPAPVVRPAYASYYAKQSGSTVLTSTDLVSWTPSTAVLSGYIVGAGYIADPVPPSPPASPPPPPPHPPPLLPPPPSPPLSPPPLLPPPRAPPTPEVYTWSHVCTLNASNVAYPLNPWTGVRSDARSAPLDVTLSTLSADHGRDLAIQLVLDDGATEHTIFYKGWYLDEVFDYQHLLVPLEGTGTVGTVYARYAETDAWSEFTTAVFGGGAQWWWRFVDGYTTGYIHWHGAPTPFAFLYDDGNLYSPFPSPIVRAAVFVGVPPSSPASPPPI